jgi:hypothetical protein
MKKIIYIMGAGRSGTTLLDTILGNNPDIFSAGELNRFPKYHGLPLLVGAASPTAVFWNEFKAKLIERMSADKFKTTHKLCHSFEYHTYVYKTWLPFYGKSLKRYQDYLRIFFTTLETMVKESTIVDSSKYPMRGYYLSKLLDYEMVYIYIKRNPIDIIRSFAKKGIEQPSQGWFPANVYMFMVNTLSIYIIRKLRKKHKHIVVLYDDLIANPAETIAKIGRYLDLDVSHAVKLVEDGKPFQKGLLFDGNRLRLENEIFLRNNETGTRVTSLKDAITIGWQVIWWNKRRRR